MGVLSGTLSYKRYFVEGELPENLRETFLERVQMYAIPELTLDNEEEETSGWANIESLLDVEFSYDSLFHEDYVLLTFRMDRWKVPPTLLKAYLLKAEKAFLEEHGRERVTKRERDTLKETVRHELKQRQLPSVAAYDLCWHLEQGVLRFWSHSNGANERMVELFEKTFDVSLVPQSPYTLAERAGLEEEELVALTELELEPFSSRSVERVSEKFSEAV